MNRVLKIILMLTGICLVFSSCAKNPDKTFKMEIPTAPWEKIYFHAIDSATASSGIRKLRETNLGSDDLEIRIWRGFGLEPLEGVILNRTSGSWSAKYIKSDSYSQVPKIEVKELNSPKNGWETLWNKLNEQEIMTIPDPTEKECPGGQDGTSYVVEINKDDSYRTYMYWINNPKCIRVEKIKAIGRVIAEQFYDGVGECTRAEWLPCVAKFGVQNDL